MPSFVTSVTFDPAFVEAVGWGGPDLWFVRVPEGNELCVE